MVRGDPHLVADLGEAGGVAALLATDGEDEVDLVLLHEPLEGVLALAGGFADGVAEAELAAFGHDHGLEFSGELHQFGDVLGRLADDGDLARRGDDPLALGATRGVPWKIGDLLGGDGLAGSGPADDAANLGMPGVAVDHQVVALTDELLGEALDLGDERTGAVDELEACGGGLLGEMGSHAVGGDCDASEAALLCLIDGGGALDAAAAQALDDLRVVDHVTDGGDRAGDGGGLLDDVEGATDAPAVAEFRGDDDALGRDGGGIGGGGGHRQPQSVRDGNETRSKPVDAVNAMAV